MTPQRLLLLAACLCSNNAVAFVPPSTKTSLAGTHRTNHLTHDPLNHPSASTSSTRLSAHLHRDILIIGSGLAGLSVAHRLATTSTRHVTILERESPRAQKSKTAAGSFAAAGMLAPQSERMAAGPLLDLCLRSREMYGEWVESVEAGAREACGGDLEGSSSKHLWDVDASKPEPWKVGFHSAGGFLAPAFAGDAVATWSPQPRSGEAIWLDDAQIRELEPLLHPSVAGGWWFPEDASVDARRLTCSLRAACEGAGVQILSGREFEAVGLEAGGGRRAGVRLSGGRVYQADAVVVANGSWMKNLLPVPVVPHKGQSLSLRMPSDAPPLLSRVLFAQDTYIVPKSDGRIVIGATVEPGRYDGDVTPEGMLHCLSEATRLVPSLKDLPIEETWAGLRPTTPDKCPILGSTLFDNVYVAGGYWRNGVLLAPKTGQLVGDLILNDGDAAKMSKEDAALLEAFGWDRFTKKGGGAALAANARHASSLYPVHKRSSFGVSSSVGTELGFYEGASAARGDRERDRMAMFGFNEEEEERLERAARLGVSDAGAFDFGGGDFARSVDVGVGKGEESGGGEEKRVVVTEADPDALTVGVVGGNADAKDESIPQPEEPSQSSDLTSDLPSIYEKIKANKAKAAESIEMGRDTTEQKPDLPFRIYHVDKATRETIMVPPYTSPGEFMQMKEEGRLKPTTEFAAEVGRSSNTVEKASNAPAATTPTQQSQETYDGYSAIREAFGEGTTEEETAAATRRARMANRIKSSEIDESVIGAMPLDDDSKLKVEKEKANGSAKPSGMFMQKKEDPSTIQSLGSTVISNGAASEEETDETTLDGYQAIQSANSSESREDELDRMREARIRNRIKSTELDDLFNEYS